MKKYYFDDNDDVKFNPKGGLFSKRSMNKSEYDDYFDNLGDIFPDDEDDKAENLLNALRKELKNPENERGELDFVSDGVEYTGIPMLEVNSNKFVFKLVPSNQMKMFILSDIVVN